MKKLLISILIVLLIALSIFIALNGFRIGSLEVLGIKRIQEKNEQLDISLEQATKLASIDYKKAIGDVQENATKLTEEKKRYDDITALNADTQGEVAQIQKYEIETLWVKLGNHATSEGCTIKIEVTKGTNTTQDTYNLNFTAKGSYISITDFISDIENDSTLGFKIENFKMIPSGEEDSTLQATFVCKDIAIKEVDTSAVMPQRNINTNNTTNTNSINTNSTNNNTNTNNTNMTNTTGNTNPLE